MVTDSLDIVDGMHECLIRKEVKDLLAYLRVLVNPSDEVSLQRIINTPKRGIGDRALDVIGNIAKSESTTFWSALSRAKSSELTPKAAASISAFVSMMSALQVLVEANRPPATIAAAVLEQSGLLSELRASGDPQDEVRVENLEELVAVIEEYEERIVGEGETPTLAGFLEEVSLVADADEIPEG